MDFGRAVGDLAGFIVRNSVLEAPVSSWTVLRAGVHECASGAGGFFGYNSQWEELILGWELNYSHTNLVKPMPRFAFADHLQRRRPPPGHHFIYDVTVSGSARCSVTDFAHVARAGGLEIGNFLPYALLGPGIGRADVIAIRDVRSSERISPDCRRVPPRSADSLVPRSSSSETDTKHRRIPFSAVRPASASTSMLMPQVFVRGEYEALTFPTSGHEVSVQTVRTGVGIKF